MTKRVVFLTGKRIGSDASESIHLYKRIVSFKKCADVSIITQSTEDYPEQAGCKQVVHLDSNKDSHAYAVSVVKQADMFVVVGMPPNKNPSAALLGDTRPECCIAVINKGCMDLPDGFYRENLIRMKDMSISTGLLFLLVYRWMMDIVEE